MVETAVRRNPKAPSFSGLDAYLSYALDETGGVVTTEFQKHMSEQQKAQAIILRQSRLYREESEADAKASRDGKGGGKGDGPDPKKKAKKDKRRKDTPGGAKSADEDD